MNPSLEVHDARAGGSRLRGDLARRCRLAWLVAAVMTIVSAGALLMLAAGLITLFQARRFYTEVVARRLAQAVLWVCGVRVVVHRDEPFPEGQTVFISNHTSTLDLFILLALALPNARFFLSGFLRGNLPLGVMGYLTGTFWTVPQSLPQQRTRIFQRAERVLRRTGESVYLSPEGERVTTGEIGPFNKGAFHLATNLQAPIVPLYIAIPREVDPGRGWDARPGVVHVTFKPALATAGWQLPDLDRHRQQVRAYFLELHKELKPG